MGETGLEHLSTQDQRAHFIRAFFHWEAEVIETLWGPRTMSGSTIFFLGFVE